MCRTVFTCGVGFLFALWLFLFAFSVFFLCVVAFLLALCLFYLRSVFFFFALWLFYLRCGFFYLRSVFFLFALWLFYLRCGFFICVQCFFYLRCGFYIYVVVFIFALWYFYLCCGVFFFLLCPCGPPYISDRPDTYTRLLLNMERPHNSSGSLENDDRRSINKGSGKRRTLTTFVYITKFLKTRTYRWRFVVLQLNWIVI